MTRSDVPELVDVGDPFVRNRGDIVRYLIILLLLMSPIGHALDKNRLWLPVRYQSLYLPLVEAASVAEALERCVAVVEGTLDLEQSKPDHPIYRIQCRQANGLTYNEMVDGVSFTALTTVETIESEPTAEDIAQRKRAAWQECREQLVAQTQLMKDLRWEAGVEGLIEPDVYSEEEVRFLVNFDARSMKKEPLRYTAECLVRNDLVEVVLRKR